MKGMKVCSQLEGQVMLHALENKFTALFALLQKVFAVSDFIEI